MKNRASIVPAALALSLIFNLQPVPACAQGTAFTYQGRVTDNGTNFTGTGLFKFALVTGTNTSQQATATANAPSGGYITGYIVTFGGNGYVTAPAVTVFGGGGAGAAAHANLTSGVVTSLSVDNPGNGGYTNAPTVLVAAPPPNISYTTYWSNDGTSVNGSEPSAAVAVGVSNGLFTVVLGDTTQSNMTAIPASLFNQSNLQVRIWFNDGVNGSAALDPAQNLTPVPYAIFAEGANAAGVSGILPAGGLSGTYGSAVNLSNASNSFNGGFSGNGGGLTNVNAATVGGLTPANFWQTSGNTGTSPTNGNFVGTADAQPIELRVGGLRGWRVEPDPRGAGAANLIGGYISNSVEQPGSGGDFIGGGGYAGGFNTIYANSSGAFIGAGSANQVGPNVNDAVIAGGFGNNIGGDGARSVIGGGYSNTVSGAYATVGGGSGNTASGSYATVAGGGGNKAGGNYSFAAGAGAQALGNGDFVWSDNSGGTFQAAGSNIFAARATGGFALWSSDSITGVSLASGSGSWSSLSDRNAKNDFAPVNPGTVLAGVSSLPMTTWSYKTEQGVRHIGPMAQDFYSAFGVGENNKYITEVDEGGVALAAIQGLNQKVDELKTELNRRDAENAELKQRLETLEQIVLKQKSN